MVCESCMKVVLIVVNIGVLILGAVLLILGAIVTWGYSAVANIIQPFLTTLTSSNALVVNGVQPTEIASYILDLLKYIGWPLFLIGAIIMAIAVCGILGACCGLRLLLLVYVIVAYGITAALIALCIAFYAADEQIDTFIKKYLIETVYEFTGKNATNVQTVLWILINHGFECCGVNNGSDFKNATKWPRNVTEDGSTYYVMEYPLTCCKLDASFNRKYTSCPKVHNATTSNYEIGCYAQLRKVLKGYSYIGLGVVVAIIVLEMTMMLFAACVCQAAIKIIPDPI